MAQDKLLIPFCLSGAKRVGSRHLERLIKHNVHAACRRSQRAAINESIVKRASAVPAELHAAEVDCLSFAGETLANALALGHWSVCDRCDRDDAVARLQVLRCHDPDIRIRGVAAMSVTRRSQARVAARTRRERLMGGGGLAHLRDGGVLSGHGESHGLWARCSQGRWRKTA